MADRMLRAIKSNTHSTVEEQRVEPMQEALTRLYALLHDLPHVPLDTQSKMNSAYSRAMTKTPQELNGSLGDIAKSAVSLLST